MNMPMNTHACISILSAVRNEEEYLAEMIESVLAQDLLEWELLLVDDGSSDRTSAIILEYVASDARIRLVSHGIGLGKVPAFNLAFSASTGDVIVLLAGDDRIPEGSLRTRYEKVSALRPDRPAVAYFKIRTFSVDPRYNDMTLPRGKSGSRSGGSITMNRTLAEMLFPINESLISEDIWLGLGTESLASSIVDHPAVVLEYRIHAGNSNPRQASFPDMTESIHQRHRAWLKLSKARRLPLSEQARIRFMSMWTAEEYRYRGSLLKLARTRGFPLNDKIALISMANPALFAFRTRFYRYFSGRRGR